ncbi:lytic transglycosylase domain-containing protein [Thioalkalivibrio sp. ALE19]|uniref:lytic transglycosylase domain-containing protein n=1 Tax=Thioalkalivibrio sp. ALE19 TaxID=1266909 RepID=UPI0018CB5752|nr:lytic transglycosylase domain-containing protein [Thioalkalivibrio sp. ALE19]
MDRLKNRSAARRWGVTTWLGVVLLAAASGPASGAGPLYEPGVTLADLGANQSDSPSVIVARTRSGARVAHFFRSGETTSHHAEVIESPRAAGPKRDTAMRGGGPAQGVQIDPQVRPYDGVINTRAFRALIDRAAEDQGVPSSLLRALIHTESSFRSDAESHAGAVGLMQLMPETAQRFGVSDRRDPVQNVYGGARYIRHLIDKYGDLEMALAAYNAGEGAVRRYGGIPPFEETQQFVPRVYSRFARYQIEESGGQVAARGSYVSR